MARKELRAAFATLYSLSLLVCGCTTSSSPVPLPKRTEITETSDSSTPTAKPNTPSDKSDGQSTSAKTGVWEDYPDVPKIEIMTEVDGIKIPRQALKSETLQLIGKIPADVGNPLADKSGQPVDGDTLTIRFPSEPKVLNPITENSAVRTYMCLHQVQEGLARQNPETFEFEPLIAKQWVIEDSIKLSPDYPGHERRITAEGGTPQTTLEFEYTAPPPATDGKKPSEPPVVTFTTSDKDGKPIGEVWVGVYPIGSVEGAPLTGYHYWSNPDGKVHISALSTGKYTIKVGAEVYGKATRGDDKSLTITPATPENPLHEWIRVSGEPTLTLKEGDWTDLHLETYYTYYLRDDVKWSDGTPFTSKDIEFAYALLNSPHVDGDSIRTYYEDLIECSALDLHVVRMRYRQQYFLAFEFTFGITAYTPPFHFFSNIFKEQGRELVLDSLTPDEEKTQNKISARGQEFGKFFNTDSRYNRAPLGTGPYIIEKWQPNDRVELVKNANYWNKPRAGHLDRLVYKFIIDQVTAMAALKAGEIDFFYDMAPEQYFEDWPNIDKSQRDDYVQASWYSPMFSFFGWNFLAPQFQDRRVRIAMALLFDRQDFVDTKLHGAGVVVSGTQYYFGPGYDQEVAPLGYDPDTASELLAAAGWIDTDNDGILDRDGVKFKVTLRTAKGRPINTQRCLILQKNLKQAGIDLQIDESEWASFIEKLRSKECDVTTLSWATAPEADPFQIWHSSGAGRHNRGSNTISFANPEADSLIEMLRVTTDLEKRKRIHASFHRLLDSEQPFMFLWIPKEFGAYHKRFRNVKWYRLRPGFDLSEWYVPKDEQLH
ncbi:MAG: extracellular solute-binding protein family 5 [Schlesneria sp.]|nr:extracellular solute-binding protein family 5 [Schlesneria sp.]